MRISLLPPLISVILATLACTVIAGTPTLSNIRMATDDTGKAITNTYSPGDEFYVFVDLMGLQTGSVVEAKWYVLDATGVEINSLINTSDYAYQIGINFVYFHLTTSDGSDWPIGKYKVEIYLNSILSGEKMFYVQ